MRSKESREDQGHQARIRRPDSPGYWQYRDTEGKDRIIHFDCAMTTHPWPFPTHRHSVEEFEALNYFVKWIGPVMKSSDMVTEIDRRPKTLGVPVSEYSCGYVGALNVLREWILEKYGGEN